jgi:hypothetical protein
VTGCGHAAWIVGGERRRSFVGTGDPKVIAVREGCDMKDLVAAKAVRVPGAPVQGFVTGIVNKTTS